MSVNPRAGQQLPPGMLADVAGLVAAYHERAPDPDDPAQRVAFGTSGHRGSSLTGSFNEAHILAITQAICEDRAAGRHRRAAVPRRATPTPCRSPPSHTALEVLAGNGVEVMIPEPTSYTPTPALSRTRSWRTTRPRAPGSPTASSSRRRTTRRRTAASSTTRRTAAPRTRTSPLAIEERANALLEDGLRGVRRMPFEQARRAPDDAALRLPGALRGRPGRRRRSGRGAWRRAPARRRPARRLGRPLLGRHRRALRTRPDGGERRGGPDLRAS